MEFDWTKLLSTSRFRAADGDRKRPFHEHYGSQDFREPHEKDFDRLIFSAPVRRLQDKTQIFPLDQHDSVRTRLTHSLEVTNIARTLAAQFVEKLRLREKLETAERAVPALVATIAIAHDVGNPPFGHQGEEAIRAWVKKAQPKFWGTNPDAKNEELLKDYLYFDGNPQAFRLVTRLQGVEEGGLNLTASTLRAFFKYPWGSNASHINPNKPKFGFFHSEKDYFDWCAKETGLPEKQLHPLTPIMEACDDIAYSVLDVEDGIKKELASPAHLMVYLRSRSIGTAAEEWIRVLNEQYEIDLKWLADEGISGKYAEDVLTQLLRSYLIALAVSVAVPSLVKALGEGLPEKNVCLAEDKCRTLLSLLKDYSREYIYSHRSVEKIELEGHRVIPYLLSAYWIALDAVENKRASKLHEYVVKHIPNNYRRVYEGAKFKHPAWYARLQLVCDMVSGMTDSYAVKMSNDFTQLDVETNLGV